MARSSTIPVRFNGTVIYRCSSLTGKVIYPEAGDEDGVASNLAEVEALHRWADDQPVTREKVYFVGGDVGPIKIGYTTNLIGRLRQLQPASPVEMKVLAVRPGGRLRETAYHCQFDEHRIRGEWFARCDAILAEIRRLRLEVKRAEKRAQRRALTEGSNAWWW